MGNYFNMILTGRVRAVGTDKFLLCYFADGWTKVSVWLSIPRVFGSEILEVLVLQRKTGVSGTAYNVSLADRSFCRQSHLCLAAKFSHQLPEEFLGIVWVGTFSCSLCLVYRFNSAVLNCNLLLAKKQHCATTKKVARDTTNIVAEEVSSLP